MTKGKSNEKPASLLDLCIPQSHRHSYARCLHAGPHGHHRPPPTTEQLTATIANALFTLNTIPNRMEVTTEAEDNPPQTGIIESIPPDRKHITAAETEILVVSPTVYLRTQADAPWMPLDAPAGTYLGDTNTALEKIIATISEPRLVQTDTLNGQLMNVYLYTSTTRTNGIDLSSRTELWINPTDARPYKMVIRGEVLAVSNEGAGSESQSLAVKTTTTVLITYPTDLKIAAPEQ